MSSTHFKKMSFIEENLFDKRNIEEEPEENSVPDSEATEIPSDEQTEQNESEGE